METAAVIRIFFLTTLSFVLAMSWTPGLSYALYRLRVGKQIRDSGQTPIYTQLHKHKQGTPTMGGILVWLTVLVLAGLFWLLARWLGGIFSDLNFLSRGQTLLPLGALVASAIVGLVDDIFNAKKIGSGQGVRFRHKIIIYLLIAAFGAFWFYGKLDWDQLHIPFFGNFNIGWWYLPIFILIILGTSFSVNQTDGLDGLAGGSLLVAFISFGAIALVQGRSDLAAFCGVIAGALMAFLWFNINPARFFMGDTGSMSLGVTLGLVAILTNSILLLPLIAFIPMVEGLTTIMQIMAKKFWHRKLFLSAPIHHHFEARGWSEPKVVMRFWIISAVSAVIGLLVFMIER